MRLLNFSRFVRLAPLTVAVVPLVAPPVRAQPSPAIAEAIHSFTDNSPAGPEFFILSDVGWRVAREYGADPVLHWTPAHAGQYVLQVWVRSAASTAPYEAWAGTGAFTVANGPLSVAGFAADRTLPIGVGGTVSWHVTTAGGDGTSLEYQFFRHNVSAGTSLIARAYGPSPDWSWTPGGLARGASSFRHNRHSRNQRTTSNGESSCSGRYSRCCSTSANRSGPVVSRAAMLWQ